MQGRYLRFPRHYDKWGVLGKVLLVQELVQEGELPSLTFDQMRILINTAFPRELACTRQEKEIPRAALMGYYSSVRDALILQEMKGEKAERVALQETAERYCLDPRETAEILQSTVI